MQRYCLREIRLKKSKSKICSLSMERFFCCGEQVLNLAFSFTKPGYLQLISKILRGESLDASPAEVHEEVSIKTVYGF